MTELFTYLSSLGFVRFGMVWFLVLIAVVVIFGGLWNMLMTIVWKLPNRFLRHRSIKIHGWPPPHCDADGDIVVAEPPKPTRPSDRHEARTQS